MAKMDLGSMSKSELEKLKAEVDKALAGIEQRRKSDARKAAEDAARKFGFSLGELVGRERGRKPQSAAKYRNPADPEQTWSGRGRQPGWLKEGLAKGKTLADFAI
jgi:DNA-binding protein H-NS